MKASEFTEVARGNGIPCYGDLIEGTYNGEKYRAEFYLDRNPGGHLFAGLAADSYIEKFENGEWKIIKDLDDDTFNAILNSITPDVEE